jgi:hypothetical protein
MILIAQDPGVDSNQIDCRIDRTLASSSGKYLLTMAIGRRMD